jgi:hypothetical protein
MMDIKTPFPVNTPLPFYGVDGNRLKLGDKVYEAVEDPDDGYRSCLGSVEVRADGAGIFFPNPVDTVVVVDLDEPRPSGADGAADGWALTSTADGHVWLAFGTEHYDQYYPGFLFRYSPRTKETQE